MDPLSIAAAIITCVQIANNLKQNVEKVGQNRRRMLHLAEEVVQSLSELQSFCADHTADLEVSRDLKKAVKQLESECCDPPQRNRGYLSKPKAYFKMWQKSGKIEEDIEHIRDAIRSSISRLTNRNTGAPARIENGQDGAIPGVPNDAELTVASIRCPFWIHDDQYERLSSHDSDLWHRSCGSGNIAVYQSLSDTMPDEIDHNYLLYKIQTIMERHSSLDLSTLPLPLPDASGNRGSMIQREFACALGQPSMHEVLNQTWSVFRFLDDLSAVQSQSTQYFSALILLGCNLARFGYTDSAILVHSATSELLGRWHTIPGGKVYVPYLGLTLSALTWSLALEKDDPVPHIGHQAIRLLSASSYHDAPSLCGYIFALRVLVYCSFGSGQYEETLRYARRALEVMYSANMKVIPEAPTTISWVVFWGVSPDNSLPIAVERDVWITQSAGFFLYWAANALSSLGRWEEALTAANDAMNILTALRDGYDETILKMNLLHHYVDDLVQEIPRWELNRDTNAGPPIQTSSERVTTPRSPGDTPFPRATGTLARHTGYLLERRDIQSRMYVDEFYVIGFSKAVAPADTVIVALNALALVRKAETGAFSLDIYDVSYTPNRAARAQWNSELRTPGLATSPGLLEALQCEFESASLAQCALRPADLSVVTDSRRRLRAVLLRLASSSENLHSALPADRQSSLKAGLARLWRLFCLRRDLPFVGSWGFQPRRKRNIQVLPLLLWQPPPSNEFWQPLQRADG
ncbi:hypothetical protein PLEOSDRAFT_171384 [Pleurotus ostreatus PC15]|uniref:Fungal N-terminal domain-containing protein n=1 Tax=Pleurotus ostreatus (strain PC15) TaxID=1137138 RepID=A0A067N5D7_PLEO1|nr:hypothetical protein PLEOSDRAFT_171384 [Pleurotus ostreatus PC15]